jgi:hypothetical protein
VIHEYASASQSGRTSTWAICCISAAAACVAAAAAAVALAVLPSAWVGHPFLRLVAMLHPGTDAPDNWAFAAEYVIAAATIPLLAVPPLLFAGNPKFWVALMRHTTLARRTKVN